MGLSARVRTVVITVTIANGTATANGATSLLNGVLRSVSINAPALTSANYVFTITGPAAGFTLLNKTALTPNALTNYISDGTGLPTGGLAVSGDSTVTITTAGNEAAQRVFTITCLVER